MDSPLSKCKEMQVHLPSPLHPALISMYGPKYMDKYANQFLRQWRLGFLLNILLLLFSAIQIIDGTCPRLKLATAGLIWSSRFAFIRLFTFARNTASDIFLLLSFALTPEH